MAQPAREQRWGRLCWTRPRQWSPSQEACRGGGNNNKKQKNEKENEKSYEAVSGKKETVNKLVNKHIQMNKNEVGTGLVGARISECDGNRAGRDARGLELREQQPRACGGDHKEGAGQPARPN